MSFRNNPAFLASCHSVASVSWYFGTISSAESLQEAIKTTSDNRVYKGNENNFFMVLLLKVNIQPEGVDLLLEIVPCTPAAAAHTDFRVEVVLAGKCQDILARCKQPDGTHVYLLRHRRRNGVANFKV